MKNLIITLTVLFGLTITSCEGPVGPPGPPGFDGINILGQVFERTVDFQYDFDFNYYLSPLITIPSSVEVFESDVLLVYRYEGTENGLDIWGQIPQNFFLNDGLIIQYVFNHTFVDVQLIIDGNLIGDELGPQWTRNQTFRIAVVPAEFADANLTMEELENIDTTEFIEF